MRTSEQGFMTISLMALLPLLLAITAAIGGALLIMRSDGETRHLCRITVLEAQEKVAKNVNALIDLNPKASFLRAERKSVEALLAVTPAPLRPPIEARRLAIIAQQTLLAARQKALLAEATRLSYLSPASIRAKVSHAMINASDRQIEASDRLTANVAIDLKTKTPSFALTASPPKDLTPDYHPPSDFSNRQILGAKWSMHASALLPKWIRAFVRSANFRLSANCSATIVKEQGKWNAKLIADKR